MMKRLPKVATEMALHGSAGQCVAPTDRRTIQTTAIDKDAELLRLTTVLAHSSGEWISSEWPVCPIADIGSAQRMGVSGLR